MESYSSYLLFLVIVGAIFYVVDLKFGVPFKSRVRNRTGEVIIGERDQVGFLYNKKFGSRLTVAFLIIAAETTFKILNGHPPFTELFTAIVDIPAVMLGFYLGSPLARFLVKAEKGISRVESLEDRINRGETTLKEEMSSVVQTTSAQVRERLSPVLGNVPPSRPAASNQPPAPVEPAEPTAEEAKAGFDRFVNRDR